MLHRKSQGKASEGSKRGFTLIELLVVIAIIGLLAAILFPVFERARENAHRATCQSNLKEVGIGLVQYEQDFDERFPSGYYDTSSTFADHTGMNWAADIYTYEKSDQIYLCPDDTPNTLYGGPEQISYAFNEGLNMPHGPNGTYIGAISEMTASAQTVMLFECAGTAGTLENIYANTGYGSAAAFGLPGDMTWQWAHGGGWYATGFMGGRGGTLVPNPTIGMSASVTETGEFQYPTGRHLDGSNFLMADGHVKWFQGSQVSTGWAAATPTTQQSTSVSYPTTSPADGTSATEADGHAVTFSVI